MATVTSNLTFSTAGAQPADGPGTPLGITYNLPSYLDPSSQVPFGTSILSFSFGGSLSVSAGLSGHIDLTLGSYSLAYPVAVNMALPDSVMDGQVFTVDPTLGGVTDATFSLTGPGASAALDLGLAGNLSFYFNPGSLIGASFSIDPNFSFEYSLPTTYSFSLPVPGASIKVGEPSSFSATSPAATAVGSLPALTASGTDTQALLTAQLDLVKLLASLLGPEVTAALGGSYSASVGSLSYSLLSAPLAASLQLGQSETITPTGIGVILVDENNGETQTGTLGQQFSFDAPTSDSGEITLSATYMLDLQISTATGVVGSVALTLKGPSVNGTFAGADFSIGPLGSSKLFDISTGLGTVDSASYVQNLTTTDTYDIAYAMCFLAGTHLRTARGEVRVEELRVGDLMVVPDGMVPDGARARLMPVRWIGRNPISRRFADPQRLLPIRIRAGALAENVPARDLLVSPDHGVLIDGVLVHAHALVNGCSILRAHDVPTEFTYYHVELDSHALLLSEGAATESFLECLAEMPFVNWDERSPVEAGGELPYPRCKSVRQLPRAIRDALAARAQRLFSGAAAA